MAASWRPRLAAAPLAAALEDHRASACSAAPVRQIGAGAAPRSRPPDFRLRRRGAAGGGDRESDRLRGRAAAGGDPRRNQRVPSLLPAIRLSVESPTTRRPFLLTGSADLLLLPTVSERRPAGWTWSGFSRRPRRRRKATRSISRASAGRVEAVRPRRRAGPEVWSPGSCREDFPGSCTARPSRAPWHRAYVDALVNRDVRDVSNLRSLDQLAALLSLLAHQTAQLFKCDAPRSCSASAAGPSRTSSRRWAAVLPASWWRRSLDGVPRRRRGSRRRTCASTAP